MDLDDVPGVAARQYGVFLPAQAYAEGWTPRQLKRRVAASRWRWVVGSGLAATQVEIGPWQLASCVTLTWPGAVVSHELAGYLYAFPLPAPVVGVGTVEPSRALRAPGLRAHRQILGPDDVRRLGGLRATTEQRTAADLLATLNWTAARDLWAWLSTRSVLSRPGLERAADVREHAPGVQQLRRLLRVSAGGSLSAAEDVLHELLRRAGITGWSANQRVMLDGRVLAVADVLFTQIQVVVEVDGYRAHKGREAFQQDRTRQNRLVAAGYVVLRFTWSDLTERPEYVIRTIRTAVER